MSPELTAARDAAQKALDARAAFETTMGQLAADRRALLERRTAAQAAEQSAAKAAGVASPPIDSITQHAATRSALRTIDDELEAVDQRIIAEHAKAADVDAVISSRGRAFLEARREHDAAYVDALQKRLLEAVNIIKNVALEAAACRGYIPALVALDDLRVPYLRWPTSEFGDLPRQPMLTGAAAFLDGKQTIFREAFAQDQSLVSLHREMRGLGLLDAAVANHLTRIDSAAAAAHDERMQSDPVYRDEHQRQQRERQDAEAKARRLAAAQHRLQRAREELDREERLHARAAKGEVSGYVFQPNHLGHYRKDVDDAEAELEIVTAEIEGRPPAVKAQPNGPKPPASKPADMMGPVAVATAAKLATGDAA